MIIDIQNKEELENINKNHNLVLADFWATWCGPCRMLVPILEKVDAQLDNLIVAKINVDNLRELATEYDIRSIPTLVLFKDGIPVSYHSGFISSNNLIDWINDN